MEISNLANFIQKLTQSVVSNLNIIESWPTAPKIEKGQTRIIPCNGAVFPQYGFSLGDLITFTLSGYQADITPSQPKGFFDVQLSAPIVSRQVMLVAFDIHMGPYIQYDPGTHTYVVLRSDYSDTLDLTTSSNGDTTMLKSIVFFVKDTQSSSGITASGAIKNFGIKNPTTGALLGVTQPFSLENPLQTIQLSEGGKQGVLFSPGIKRSFAIGADSSEYILSGGFTPNLLATIKGYTVVVGSNESYIELPQ